EFEDVSAPLTEVDVLVHHCLKLLDTLNPVVFNRVRQTAEDIELVPQTTRQHLVHLLVLGIVIDEVEHVHRTSRLAEAFDASEALLQARWVPWQVHIDERAEGLQIESFARGIRSDNEANVALLDCLLDVLTLDGGTRIAPEDAALAGTGVHGYRFIGED